MAFPKSSEQKAFFEKVKKHMIAPKKPGMLSSPIQAQPTQMQLPNIKPPVVKPPMPAAAVLPPATNDATNPNFVGNPQATKFKKLKRVFGQ